MIGPGLKNLASELSFKLSDGVAYGEIRGYLTTLSEGMGYKAMHIALYFDNPTSQHQIRDALTDKKNMRQYRITQSLINELDLSIVFYDNPGTMKRIRAFIDWFFPQLISAGVTGASHCSDCHAVIADSDRVIRIINGNAFNLHRACAEKLADSFEQAREAVAQENPQTGRGIIGGILGGIIGGILGGIIGAIPWAIVYALGYFVAWLGFVIGFCVFKGYTLMGGKVRRHTVVIIALIVVLAAAFACLLGDAITIGYMIANGEVTGISYGQIPELIIAMLQDDSEYLSGVLVNLGLSLVFAALGVFGLLRKVSLQAPDRKVKVVDPE